MKTGKLLAVLMVVAWILSVPCLMAEQNAPAAVQQAAIEGLHPFLNKISVDSLEQYGFIPGDVRSMATLGTPFLMYTITPSALAKYRTGMSVASMVTPTTMWYFPVLMGGQTRAILVVDQINNQWQAVSLGYAGLAGELGALSRQWNVAQGYHPMLIVVFQAKQYLFTVPEKGAYNLTRLTANRPEVTDPLQATKSLADDYATLGTVDAAMAQLKPVVKNTLKVSNR